MPIALPLLPFYHLLYFLECSTEATGQAWNPALHWVRAAAFQEPAHETWPRALLGQGVLTLTSCTKAFQSLIELEQTHV